MMNVAHKPFDNKLVRQAVNYSVDAPAIVKNIFDGIGYTIDVRSDRASSAPIRN
jgi:ABC-type transport system substrate-binding protein